MQIAMSSAQLVVSFSKRFLRSRLGRVESGNYCLRILRTYSRKAVFSSLIRFEKTFVYIDVTFQSTKTAKFK